MRTQTAAKDRILAFASDKFFQEGFAKISVEEIASSLVISKKTFYNSFDSKHELVVQMMDRFLALAGARLAQIMDADKSFIEKLGDTMTYLAQEVGRFSRPFQADLQRHAPDIWKRIETFRRQRIAQNLSLLLEQGMAEGFIRKDTSKQIFLLSYLGAVENVLRPSVLSEEPFSTREALVAIMAMFFHGILTEEASRKLKKLQYNHFS